MNTFFKKFFIIYWLLSFWSLIGSLFLEPNSMKEFWYELWHKIRTGQSIEVTYVGLYIIVSDEDLTTK